MSGVHKANEQNAWEWGYLDDRETRKVDRNKFCKDKYERTYEVKR